MTISAILFYTGGKLHGIIHEVMYITELAKDTGASVDQIRYLEKKGFVESTWMILRKRKVRFYSTEEASKVRLIIKYLSQGYRYDVAYEKAIEEIQKPQLI